MNVRSSDLVALIGSRICHDLISPIGAIGNGIELIGLSGAGAGPEMALISESVTNAQARIRFYYRVAFGAGKARTSPGPRRPRSCATSTAPAAFGVNGNPAARCAGPRRSCSSC